MPSNALGVHPQHALAVYAESMADGARVAVFGDASLGLGARLAELGARAVHVWDPDGDRAAEEAESAPHGVVVRPYAEHDPDVRPIDLAIIADLGLFDDPASLVRRVRRMVGEEGVALVAAQSIDAKASYAGDAKASYAGDQTSRPFDYYDLFDLVAPEFESVRMVGQLPFHGLALVELGDEDESPSVSVDTQLADGGRAVEAYVVVASQHGARLEPYAIVQLPNDARTAAAVAVRDDVLAAPEDALEDDEDDEDALEEIEEEVERAERAGVAAASDREALASAQMRVELLTGQVEELRARAAEAERALEAVAALEEALRARSGHAQELEQMVAARGRQMAELSNEVEEMRAAADAGRIAAAQVEEVARRADRAERRVDSLEQELAKGGETQSKELSEMERLLRDRALSLQQLEAELARREQMVRDLVGTLEEAGEDATTLRPPAAREAERPTANEVDGLAHSRVAQELGQENARLRAQLDALALDLARREGEAQATIWQISELERQLAQAVSEAASPAIDPQLAHALDELDTLRAALAQEHAARARAESGEELERARAEIERQAVLMEQLVRQLDARSGPANHQDEVHAHGTVGGHADPADPRREDSR